VIDASVEPEVYLDLAEGRDLTITRVLDTHVHADHLSRSKALAELAGAELHMPEGAPVSYPFSPLADGDEILIGEVGCGPSRRRGTPRRARATCWTAGPRPGALHGRHPVPLRGRPPGPRRRYRGCPGEGAGAARLAAPFAEVGPRHAGAARAHGQARPLRRQACSSAAIGDTERHAPPRPGRGRLSSRHSRASPRRRRRTTSA
jgi:hypothetical protein